MTHRKTHPDLQEAKNLAYKPYGLDTSSLVLKDESQDYGACEFRINELQAHYRVAKITPTKTGQFVTFWKRSKDGPIAPYDIKDSFDLLIVSVRTEEHFGQFVFPKEALLKNGILSEGKKDGKRAFRVYPPWDTSLNSQAEKTQKWQRPYFCSLENVPKESLIRKLFSKKSNLSAIV